MTKQEFLDGLTRALSTTGSERIVRENHSFYNEYIETELRKGRSEEEVMNELGDPRLIANSIKTAAGIDDEFVGNIQNGEGEYRAQDSYSTQSSYSAEDGYQDKEYHHYTNNRENSYRYDEDIARNDYNQSVTENRNKMILYGVLGGLAVFVILLLVLATAVFRLLAPYFIPLMIIVIVMNILKKK